MFKLLFAVALLIAEPPHPPKSMTVAEAGQLQQNLDLGDLLYDYDQSAWHVTDSAREALPDDEAKLIRGYVTTPAPNGLRTTFYGESGTGYERLYSAIWTGSAIESPAIFDPRQNTPVTDEELRLIQARKIALAGAKNVTLCSDASPNVIVVPDPKGQTIHVYVLTPQTKEGVYPLGGHSRIDVRDDVVIGQRAFTNSCVEFDTSSAGSKGKPEGLIITHLLDSVPTEIHVFSVLSMRLPLYVGVRDGRVYAVEIVNGRARARLVPQ